MERKLKATFFRFGKLGRGFSENHRDCCRVLAMRIYRRLTLTFSEIDKVLSLSKQTCACAGISDLKLVAGEFKATPFHGFGRWFTNVLRVTSAFKRWSRIFELINLMFVVDFRAWWCSSIKKTQKRGVESCEDAPRTRIVFSRRRLKAASALFPAYIFINCSQPFRFQFIKDTGAQLESIIDCLNILFLIPRSG